MHSLRSCQVRLRILPLANCWNRWVVTLPFCSHHLILRKTIVIPLLVLSGSQAALPARHREIVTPEGTLQSILGSQEEGSTVSRPGFGRRHKNPGQESPVSSPDPTATASDSRQHPAASRASCTARGVPEGLQWTVGAANKAHCFRVPHCADPAGSPKRACRASGRAAVPARREFARPP